MKLKITFLLLVSVAAFAQNGAPAAPYYNGFNFNQNGMALKTALATKITDTHTKNLSYAQAKSAITIVDRDPADATKLLMLYGFSNNTCPASTSDDKDHRRRNIGAEDDGTASPCMWNREHTYPKALGTPNLGESGPGADAHHLRAADKKRNADRDNDKFMAGSGNSFETGTQWYPGDEWKGDVARMMMYMYLRYDDQCLPKNVGIGNVVSTDTNMIDLFLKWNAEDPVSAYEDARNTYLGNSSNTYGQGNRNPFIDNPYLATKIWGGPVAQDRWGLAGVSEFGSIAVSVYPNPAINNEVFIYSEAEIESIELINLNGQIVQRITKPVAENNNYSVKNLPQGFYIMTMTSPRGTASRKVVVN